MTELGSDGEDLIHTSNYFAALENESSCSGQLMNQCGKFFYPRARVL